MRLYLVKYVGIKILAVAPNMTAAKKKMQRYLEATGRSVPTLGTISVQKIMIADRDADISNYKRNGDALEFTFSVPDTNPAFDEIRFGDLMTGDTVDGEETLTFDEEV